MRTNRSVSNRRRKPGTTRRIAHSYQAAGFEHLEERFVLATLVVNTVADAVSATDGVMSLREAVSQAIATAGADEITFSPTVFATARTITLQLGEIRIPGTGESNKLTIRGPNAELTISGNKKFVAFEFDQHAFVTLEHMTISECQGSYGGAIVNNGGNLTTKNVTFLNNVADDRGGAIYNGGTLTVLESTFEDNKGYGGGGGGGAIWNEGTLTLSNSRITNNYGFAAGAMYNIGTMVIDNTLVENNRSSQNGGGITNRTQLTVVNSTFRGNQAAGTGGGINAGDAAVTVVRGSLLSGNRAGEGAGISNGTRLVITGSLLENNIAAGRGGGLLHGGPSALIEQTTISGNYAAHGGGVFVMSPAIAPPDDRFTISQSTIHKNAATGGPGLYVESGATELLNSIVAGNTSLDGTSLDYVVLAATTTARWSLIGFSGVGTISGTNLLRSDNPMLEPLQENGGPTKTHALLPGSPAIDAGSNALAVDKDGNPLPHDQRGIFSRIFNGRVDIGAFEHQGPPVDADEVIITRFNTSVAANLLENTTPNSVRTLTVPKYTISGRDYAGGQVASIANVGVFVVQQDGLFTFSPSSTFSGDAPTVTYVISDGQLTDTSTLAIRVLPQNFAPSELQLSPKTIAESSPPGAIVGQLTTVDPNPSDQFVYSLVSGAGGADNEYFEIVGSALTARSALDFETQSSYTVRVRTTDDQDLFLERPFVVSVLDVNEPPSELTLSNSQLAENLPAGTFVGTLSANDFDAGDTLVYSLVVGEGSQGNSLFELAGDRLLTAAILDHDRAPEQFLRVRVTDTQGLFVEKAFTIRVTNVNEPPVDLTLSGTSVPEDAPAGTVVGQLAAVDPDRVDTITYALVPGDGSAGNAYFQLVANELALAKSLDYEQLPSHSVRIRATDAVGAYFERSFVIAVTPVNEGPTELLLSSTSIQEQSGANALVGLLSTVDPDANEAFTYYLIAGVGSTDNRSFRIVGNELRATSSFDYKVKSSYSIRIRAMDSGGSVYDKPFTIQVVAVNNGPTSISLDNNTIRENLGPGSLVGRFSTADTTIGDQFVYTFTPDSNSLDNNQFSIIGSELRAVVSLDYETRNRYAVRIRSTDIGGLSVEKEFAILVTDGSENIPGDCDRDGIFNSTDLIIAFQAGEYEDAIAGNSTWEEGDWDGDGDFNSSDLVLAFQGGNYTVAATVADDLFAAWGDWNSIRKRR
jgi:predicted outer membrane repeat protein